ncbi:MAG: hypothetical protein GX247_02105 [Mollicutes bacterium]|nr:hypothetical protein [Mollicutes bacterium]
MKEKKNGKIKKIYIRFKEIYKVPRYRALIILGLYFVFFIFVMAIINSAAKTNVIIDNNNELPITFKKFKEMNNYEYTYKIEQSINDEIIYYQGIGKHTLEEETFTIENDVNNYYMENNEFYIIKDDLKEKVDNPLPINLLNLKPNNITDFLLASTLQLMTTDYQSNIIINTYLLPIKKFIKLYFNDEVNDEENFINIITTEKNNNIIKIEMDLTNINMNEEYSMDINRLEFNYQNIGNVEG